MMSAQSIVRTSPAWRERDRAMIKGLSRGRLDSSASCPVRWAAFSSRLPRTMYRTTPTFVAASKTRSAPAHRALTRFGFQYIDAASPEPRLPERGTRRLISVNRLNHYDSRVLTTHVSLGASHQIRTGKSARVESSESSRKLRRFLVPRSCWMNRPGWSCASKSRAAAIMSLSRPRAISSPGRPPSALMRKRPTPARQSMYVMWLETLCFEDVASNTLPPNRFYSVAALLCQIESSSSRPGRS